MKAISVPVCDIRVMDGRRKVDPGTVERIAESIAKVGLRTPVTIREDAQGFVLVAGAHRLAACRSLGMEQVPAFVMPDSATEIDARLWEIAENFARAELSALERSEHLAEWIRLTEAKMDAGLSGQVGPKLGRPESGINAASRELGVPAVQAKRAVKIDSIPQPVKAAAVEAGLGDNQSALEKIARAPEPAAKLAEIVEQRAAPKPREPEPAPATGPADHHMFDAGDFAAALQELDDLRRIVDADEPLAEARKLIAELRRELEAKERQYHGAMADRNDLIRANKALQRRLKDLSP